MEGCLTCFKVSAAFIVCLTSLVYIKNYKKKKRINDLIKRKLKEREESWAIKNDCSLSDEEISEITSLTAIEVLNALESRLWTCYEIVSAICSRSAAADSLLNCNSQVLYKKAFKRAKEIDNLISAGNYNKEELPLLGLPISVKDVFEVKGTDCTFGCAHRLYQPSTLDGELVKTLKRLGAIIITKTVVPQLLMLPETYNPVFGPCRNPYDLTRTAGGSSGGEAALIASRGSFIGLGTDLGGSGRIPASFCGIVSFKPTASRCSLRGIKTMSYLSGMEAFKVCYTPMARSVEDCVLLLKHLWSPSVSKADVRCCCVPFQEEVYNRKQPLKIGYMLSDNFFDPCPASVRAIHVAAAALEKAGHILTPLEPPSTIRRALLYYELLSSEGGMKAYKEVLKNTGETMITAFRTLYLISILPRVVRFALSWLLKLFGEHRLARLVSATYERTVAHYWRLCKEKQELQREFDDWFKQNEISALLSPATALPAYPHGMAGEITQSCSYTFAYNLLDAPAGVVPCVKVEPHEDGRYISEHNDSLSTKARKVMNGSSGLPVGVQIVGLPHGDELCLSVMRDLQQQLHAVFIPNMCALAINKS